MWIRNSTDTEWATGRVVFPLEGKYPTQTNRVTLHGSREGGGDKNRYTLKKW